MTIQNARIFLNRAMHESNLRAKIHAADTIPEMEAALKAEDLSFSHEEMEEAFTHLLTCCQTEDEAGALREIRAWWDYCVYCAMK